MSRNSLAGIGATIAVIVAVTLGFLNLGRPAQEREVHQDVRTVQAVDTLAEQIEDSWRIFHQTLPKNLDHFSASATQDPTTHAPFDYHPKTTTAYEICATFLTDDRSTAAQSQTPFWVHPKGSYCFQFDASVRVPRAPYFYAY